MKLIILLMLVAIVALPVAAQHDSIPKLTISGYGELYYSYDFSNPQNHEKSKFLYNHKRHNELNANLMLVKANYVGNHYKANIGLMVGNYPQYNLATEPNWTQYLYEANFSIRLSKKENIWLDAGIMPSHIGFESTISADCWTLTRSLLAENSPYYETGLRVSYTSKNEKLLLSGLFLNGWQRIRKPDFIQRPSFGMQVSYKPADKMTFNYSNFLGTDQPDSLKAFRHFHNFYLIYEPTQQFGFIAGFDIGVDEVNPTQLASWYSPVLILRQRVHKNTQIAIRGEYYRDAKQLIITTNSLNGFQTFAVSSNVDFDVTDKIKIRFEGKMFHSKDNIFLNNNQKNFSITSNMTIKL